MHIKNVFQYRLVVRVESIRVVYALYMLYLVTYNIKVQTYNIKVFGILHGCTQLYNSKHVMQGSIKLLPHTLIINDHTLIKIMLLFVCNIFISSLFCTAYMYITKSTTNIIHISMGVHSFTPTQ